MKKRILLICGVLIVMLSCVCLTSCSKTESNNDVLTWYMIGEKPADHEQVMEEANEIIEAEIGMKLDMQYIDVASFTEKMKLKMASAEPYDLTFTGYVNNYQTAARMNGLYDITDLVEETGLDEVIPEYYLDTALVNGRIYGIPNIQVISNPTDIEILKSVAEECEVEDEMKQIEELSRINASYEDLQRIAELFDKMFEKVYAKRPDLYVVNPSCNWFYSMIYEGVSAGAVIRRDGSDGKIVNLYETDEWKLGVKKKREWFEKGYIRKDIASVGDSLPTDDERMKVAFAYKTWKPGMETTWERQYGEQMIYAKAFEPYVSRTSALATMISVGANSNHPKRQ